MAGGLLAKVAGRLLAVFSRRLHAAEVCALCLTAALLMTLGVYFVSLSVRHALEGSDHASYAQNLAELFSATGHGCLVFQVWRASSAEGLSLRSQVLILAANLVEVFGFFVHPYPYECYVPGRRALFGSARLFLLFTALQVACTALSIAQVCKWRQTHGGAEAREMAWTAVCILAAAVFALSWLTAGNCGDRLGDAVWTLGYAIDDIALLPQVWVVSQMERATWPLANFVVFISLATMTELLSDFVGMQSSSLAGSQYASSCLMFVWNDCISLAISADFVYYYLYSLRHNNCSTLSRLELSL